MKMIQAEALGDLGYTVHLDFHLSNSDPEPFPPSVVTAPAFEFQVKQSSRQKSTILNLEGQPDPKMGDCNCMVDSFKCVCACVCDIMPSLAVCSGYT